MLPLWSQEVKSHDIQCRLGEGVEFGKRTFRRMAQAPFMSRLSAIFSLSPVAKLLRNTAVRNTASSFIALGWLSLLSMISIPIYIRLLGVSEWGLVAACVSLQLVSNFVDSGFSQIVPRWVAREAQDNVKLRRYVQLFQRIYVALGLLVFVGLQIAAGCLATSWFQVESGRTDALEMAIRIISFQMLFQFVNNLHTGLWHGLQKQVLANISACGFGTLKHVATMCALVFGPREAWLYATTFALVALIEVVTNAIVVRRMLGGEGEIKEANQISIAPFLREVSILSGGILLGLIVSQLDRIMLSRSVSIEDFGIYAVVLTLALAFLQLQTPFTRAYFPLIVQDIQLTGHSSPAHIKRMVFGTIIFATLPAVFACLFSESLLELWIHESRFIAVGTFPLQLLLLAAATNTLYNCLYVLIIAAGKSHLVMKFNLVVLVVTVLVATFAEPANGIVKGGMIWVAATVTQLVLGLVWFVCHERSKAQRH